MRSGGKRGACRDGSTWPLHDAHLRSVYLFQTRVDRARAPTADVLAEAGRGVEQLAPIAAVVLRVVHTHALQPLACTPAGQRVSEQRQNDD